jgi:maleylacetate reductase
MSLSFVHDVPSSRVLFGAGALALVGDEVGKLGGRRALVIAGGYEAGYAESIGRQLGNRQVATFGEVVMHVPVPMADRAIALAEEVAADCLVAVGGGSATGLAKAVARRLGLPILAVPTTYAGSEMTPIWGLTENARKVTGRDPRVLPRTVVYDPELTLSLPAELSAASGMNALAHLVEGLYAPGVSPVLALQAQEGVRALASSLPRVVAAPGDLQARAEALYGAWLAGWILGTTGMGVHHKICHTLGGTYDLPHAPTHSAVLSYATAFNARHAPVAMAAVVQALKAAGRPAADAAQGVWQLAVDIGAPTSLAGLGFSAADVEGVARVVTEAGPVNPRPVEEEGIRELLLAALDGSRPAPT